MDVDILALPRPTGNPHVPFSGLEQRFRMAEVRVTVRFLGPRGLRCRGEGTGRAGLPCPWLCLSPLCPLCPSIAGFQAPLP